MKNKSFIKIKKGESITPEEIRDKLDIPKEKQVAFYRDGDRIFVKPVTPISKLSGSLKNKNKTTDLKGIRRKTKEEVAKNVVKETK